MVSPETGTSVQPSSDPAPHPGLWSKIRRWLAWPPVHITLATAVMMGVFLSMAYLRPPRPAHVAEPEAQSTPEPTSPKPGAMPRHQPPTTPEKSEEKEVVTAALAPGLGRSAANSTVLRLHSVVKSVQLDLTLEAAEYATYSANLETVEGQAIWKGEDLKPKAVATGIAISVEIPAKLLDAGNYMVRLSGAKAGELEEVAGYEFKVTRIEQAQ